MTTSTQGRPYKIDGYPVSRQELLDQASMIAGRDVSAVSSAKRILSEEAVTREYLNRVASAIDYARENSKEGGA